MAKEKELTEEEQRLRHIEYIRASVADHVSNYGEDHPITVEAKEELYALEGGDEHGPRHYIPGADNNEDQ